jgi:hypothetical protein
MWSLKVFKKKNALKYPAEIVRVKSGAPSGAAATREGVMFYSETTGGAYLIIDGTSTKITTTVG